MADKNIHNFTNINSTMRRIKKWLFHGIEAAAITYYEDDKNKGLFTRYVFKDPIFVGSEKRIAWTH